MPAGEIFSSGEISFILHATEDAEKVINAIKNNLGLSETEWTENRAQGHFGNSIRTFSAVTNGELAQSIALLVSSSMSSSDKNTLLDTLDRNIDEKGGLYFRLDKQRLCKNVIALTDIDPVRIRFKPIARQAQSQSFQTYRGILSSAG